MKDFVWRRRLDALQQFFHLERRFWYTSISPRYQELREGSDICFDTILTLHLPQQIFNLDNSLCRRMPVITTATATATTISDTILIPRDHIGSQYGFVLGCSSDVRYEIFGRGPRSLALMDCHVHHVEACNAVGKSEQ
jgi:hypothetical protein